MDLTSWFSLYAFGCGMTAVCLSPLAWDDDLPRALGARISWPTLLLFWPAPLLLIVTVALWVVCLQLGRALSMWVPVWRRLRRRDPNRPTTF
jgi:hypothetical protein